MWIVFWFFGLISFFLITFVVLITIGHLNQKPDCSKCLAEANGFDDASILEDSSGVKIFPAFEINGIKVPARSVSLKIFKL